MTQGSRRQRRRGQRRLFGPFAGLTLLTVAMILPAGLSIRILVTDTRRVPEAVGLMKVAAIDDAGPQGSDLSDESIHRVVLVSSDHAALGREGGPAMTGPGVAANHSAASRPADLRPAGGPMFDCRPIRKVGHMSMLVTAYSPDHRSCGKWADGITASGYSVWTNGMKLAAADTRLLPFGTIVTVPGYNGGQPVPILDRGGRIKGRRLDVLYPTHEVAKTWGAQRLTVTVWEYAD